MQDAHALKQADLANFGFETSLEILREKNGMFGDKSLILCPLSSQPEGSLEQTYTLLLHSKQPESSFETLSDLMKTSFSLRIDKERQINDSLDTDYFGTH